MKPPGSLCERCELGTGRHAQDCAEPAPRLARAMRAATNPRQARHVLAVAAAALLEARELPAAPRAELEEICAWARRRRALPPWLKWPPLGGYYESTAATHAPRRLGLAFALCKRRLAREAALEVFYAIEGVAANEGEGRQAFEGRARERLDGMHLRAARRPGARPPPKRAAG